MTGKRAEKASGRGESQPERTEATGIGDFIGYQLRRASVFDMQGAASALEAVDLRPVLWSVLSVIIEVPGISAASICRLLGIQRANIVSLLADLEARGLTLREADASDSRIRRLFATREGELLARSAMAHLSEHEERLLAHLDIAERRELHRLLKKIWRGEEAEP